VAIYDVGDPIRLRARFTDLAGAYADPTVVTASVRSPSGVTTVYAVPPIVNDAALVGGFYLDLTLTEAGLWVYTFTGTGAVAAQDEETIRVRPSVLGGGCATWVDVETIAGCCPVTDANELEVWAQVATDVLHALSGERYLAGCAKTVRPCHVGGACCGSCWLLDGTGSCSCRDVEVWLDEDVERVTSVKVYGEEVAASTYRLDPGGYLVRTTTADKDNEGWPTCQRVDLPATETGTFEVAYVQPFTVPEMGVRAAANLACELAKSCVGQDCNLPERITSLVSQGVTMAVLDPQQFLDQGRTGLYLPDLFLAAANPHKLAQRPSVISPDFRPPRRIA
jgi:hypothetical protein